MPIDEEKKKAVSKCVMRLVLKNSSAFHLVGSAIQGWISGRLSKQVLARVFGFDPKSKSPLEDLVAESLLSGLDEKDIEDIFKRYAQRRGLDF